MKPEGSTKPSSIENDVFEGKISALRYTEIPSCLQMVIDYASRTDGQPVYMGFGAPGLSQSASGWLIQMFTYTTIGSSDYASLRQSAIGIWANRAALSYT